MTIKPHEYQQKILDSKARYILASAGIQSGKTMAGTLWLMDMITRYPKDDFLIAAPTYKILEQATLKKFFEIFPLYYNGRKTVEYKKQDSVLKIIGGGNMYIRSTEIPNNLEGMTLRAAWLDEAGLMKPAVWTNILGRTAIKKAPVLMTTTPYNVGWTYNEVERQAQGGNKDFEVFRWKSVENPFFPKEEYENAKRLLSESEFERRYNGEYRKMEGLVYPDWNPERMVFNDDKNDVKFTEVIAGIDYGFSNPTAITVMGITASQEVYVLEELYQSKLTIDEIVKEAKELKNVYDITTFYADPSAPSLIESLNVNGISTMGADNNVDLGIVRIQQLIKSDKLKINMSCNNLLEELETYHYKPLSFSMDKSPEYRKKPDKIYDHAVDSLRYAIATHPIDIFIDGSVPLLTRTNEFWERMKKRVADHRINISRYGEDYSDIDKNYMDQLWI